MASLRASFHIVLITAPRGKRAEALAKGLVAARLAACVNIVPGIVSHYRWRGRMCRETESLLLVKTSAAKLAALKRWTLGRHPYSVPEVLALKVAGGSQAYLAWLAKQVR